MTNLPPGPDGWYPVAPPPSPQPNQQNPGGLNTGAWSQPGPLNTGAWKNPEPEVTPDHLDGVPIARAGRRLISCAIDAAVILLPLSILFPVLVYTYRQTGDPEAAFRYPNAIFFVAGFFLLFNSFALPTSIGKRLMGIQAVRPVRHFGGQTLARPGFWRTLGRLMIHCFEMTFYLWLIAFFSKQYQRMPADAFTHVIHVRRTGGPDTKLPKAPSQSVNLT